MTVSEDGRTPRPRLSPEKRAQLGDEAWSLRDQMGMSSRRIAAAFSERGDQVSHVFVIQLINEAIDRAKFLDFVGPAQSRAASIGRLELALDEQWQTIRSHKAAITNTEVDYETGNALLDKAMARYLQLETLWVKVTGAAMPTRMQIEDSKGDPIAPNMAALNELGKAVAEHSAKTMEMERTDGLER